MAESKTKHKVPKYKLDEVKKLAELIDSNNTLMIASIKSLPAKSFQKIKKKLSGKAIVKVVKKRALLKAIKSSKKEKIKELETYLKEDIASIISNIDPFELASILNESKIPVKAKAGQESDKDIEIEAGVTEIPAGPAVSEFGNLSVQVKVTGGKIEVMKSKVVVKKGSIISAGASSLLGKLDIHPFSVGFIPLIAFDSKSEKIYTTLLIDKNEVLTNLKDYFAKSRALAVNLGYVTTETIGLLLSKASSHGKALEILINKQSNREENK